VKGKARRAKVDVSTFAGIARGDLFDPVRRTPIDDRDAATIFNILRSLRGRVAPAAS
jgi:hypothetical protein